MRPGKSQRDPRVLDEKRTNGDRAEIEDAQSRVDRHPPTLAVFTGRVLRVHAESPPTTPSEKSPGPTAPSGRAPDGEVEADPDANPETEADPDADPETEADPDADPETEADSEAD